MILIKFNKGTQVFQDNFGNSLNANCLDSSWDSNRIYQIANQSNDAHFRLTRTHLKFGRQRICVARKDVEHSQEIPNQFQLKSSEFSNSSVVESNPIDSFVESTESTMNFIHNESIKLRPNLLKISDIKWKYLVRSIIRGKNILMTGPAGCGKTMAARSAWEALGRPSFYFNLGASQDPRSTLIGNTHFKKDEGTYFSESTFVKAIQTKNSVILLDELSRAHPEAWNILMTVLDESQRYLRIDEHPDSPVIKVAEGVCFIGTANIGNEYTSTRVMDKALMDRFTIVEMDLLGLDDEKSLLSTMYPDVAAEMIDNVANIVTTTRNESSGGDGKISHPISTRISVELTGLISDGFTLEEACEVAVYPQYDNSGGVDSERTFIKQVVQKYITSDVSDDIFNTTDHSVDNTVGSVIGV